MIEPRYHGTLVAFAIFVATCVWRRPCARHRTAHSHLPIFARCRGQSLSPAGDQYDRCHRSSRSETDLVLSVSPSADMLVGGSANALLGNGLFDRVHVADRPAYLTALADAASEHEERLVEFRLRRDLQAERAVQFLWVEMRCRPRDLLLGKKNLTGTEIVAVLRDISERKSQSRAIEIALSESEEANAAKIRFIATMGHELRTPLNAIIGFSDMLTNESLKLDASRKYEYARLINDFGRHLLSVVDGILDASRMSTGNFEITPESFAPAPAIESCANLLALKAREAGVELRLDIGPDLPCGHGRPACVQPDPDQSDLECDQVHATRWTGSVTASRERTKLAVTVEDNGIGIDETDLPRLGEAFFQASATPMSVAMMAPGLVCRSSRVWCICMGAMSRSRAGSARGRA